MFWFKELIGKGARWENGIRLGEEVELGIIHEGVKGNVVFTEDMNKREEGRS